MIVADTNLIVYLHINGDKSPAALQVLEKDSTWIVPPLWQSEFRNVLAAYMRKGMPLSQARKIMTSALSAMKDKQIEPSSDKILELISKSQCTAYDSEFIALAQQIGITLVTADRQILKSFPETAISLEEFIK